MNKEHKEHIKKALKLIIEQAKSELVFIEREDYHFDKDLMICKAIQMIIKDDISRYLVL